MNDRPAGYLVTHLGGNCPVQAEGVVVDCGFELNFYFRSRGTGWSITIASKPRLDPLDDLDAWIYREECDTAGFSAGWITEDEAEKFIEKAIYLFWTRERSAG